MNLCSTRLVGFWLLVTFGSFLCGACAAPSPTRLYILTPAISPTSPPPPGSSAEITVGVGPVELPRYTDHLSIVTGASDHELQSTPLAQWAEPLPGNVTRILAENLSRLLATDHVTLFPWKGPAPDYQVIVDVTHFLGDLAGDVMLVALWSIVHVPTQEPFASHKSSIHVSVDTAGYDALAAAMSRTIAMLSQEIAAALRTLPTATAHP